MADSRSVSSGSTLRTKHKRLRDYLQRYDGFDTTFFILLMLVLCVGLVSLFSASSAYAYYRNNGDSYYYIKRQLAFGVAGVVVMIAASRIDYHLWEKLRWPLAIVAIGLLGAVLVLPAIHNVHRWIKVGPVQIQASEVAKLAVALLLSSLIARNQEKISNRRLGIVRYMGYCFLPYLFIIGFFCALVIVEPHLSGTILIFCIGFVIMFVGGVDWRYLATLGVSGAGVVAAMIFLKGYEHERIAVWLHPFEVYMSGETGKNQAWQTVQSLYAIGSGGLLGEGIGNSRQKHLFLPEPQNDFIFAVVCEELGFVGAIAIVLLFAILIFRGFQIAMKAPDKFGCLLCVGIMTQIGVQVALNLAVVTNTMPNTGISLPFFSYGGSSLMMLLGEMGIVLSISRQGKWKENQRKSRLIEQGEE